MPSGGAGFAAAKLTPRAQPYGRRDGDAIPRTFPFPGDTIGVGPQQRHTLLTFALRAVERVVSDQSRTNRETINQLWDILDDPHLNKALGLPQNSR